MTDNFKRYVSLITKCGGLPETNEKGNLDKYYVIELMRRGKDNPDMPAANYHFKNYYIYSWHDLEKYEHEIQEICTMFKMRAYCSVNYKLMSQVALDTMAESARRIAAHDYKKFYNIFESASGKYVDKSNSLWILDFDDVDEHFPLQRIMSCVNSMESGHEENVVFIMPTRSGLHIISHPFNLGKLNTDFRTWFPLDAYPDLNLPEVKKNHLTLLYENL